MVGVVVEAGDAPQIRIVDAHHDFVAMVDENGRTSAGSRSIARRMMYRCAAAPRANAEDGAATIIRTVTSAATVLR
jgi:hypothetical protein